MTCELWMYSSSAPISLRSSTYEHTAVRQGGSLCSLSSADEHVRASRKTLMSGSSCSSSPFMTLTAS